MPPPLPEPIHRTNINLFRSDVELLKKRYGTGWSEQVRLMVRENCKRWQAAHDELTQIMEGSDGTS